jgi:hypothetical protein
MSARRVEKRSARASKVRPAHEPGRGEASPDFLRWRSARRFIAHLLMFLGGLATLAALVREPSLGESASALLVMWGAGLSLWGFVFFLERCALGAHREAAREPERREMIPVRSVAEQGTLTPGLSRREKGAQRT